jgi:hypothetical protein
MQTGTHGTDYRAAASLGVRYLRLWDFGDVTRGNHMEPSTNQWKDHTATLTKIHRAGLTPVGVLYTRQPWRCSADGMPDIRSNAWREYVTETVRRHKSLIYHWEIWNEPDTVDFGGYRTAAEHVELTRQAAVIIRAENAGLVIGGSVSSLDNGWMDQYLEAGLAAHCDILSFHYTYTGSPDPARQADYIQRVTALRQKTGKPVWNTETSILRYRTEGGGPNVPEDAALDRILRVNRQAGVETVIYYYGGIGGPDNPESLLDWRGYLRPWARVLRKYRSN